MFKERIEAVLIQVFIVEATGWNKKKFLLYSGGKITVRGTITYSDILIILGNLKGSFGKICRCLDLTRSLFLLWEACWNKSGHAF